MCRFRTFTKCVYSFRIIFFGQLKRLPCTRMMGKVWRRNNLKHTTCLHHVWQRQCYGWASKLVLIDVISYG